MIFNLFPIPLSVSEGVPNLFLFPQFLSSIVFAKNMLICFLCLATLSFQISLFFSPLKFAAQTKLMASNLCSYCPVWHTGNKFQRLMISKALIFSHSLLYLLLLAILAILCIQHLKI